MEEVLQNCTRGYDKDPEHTSAILAVPESDYNRLWSKLWHWKTLKSFKKGEWIFNQYEAGELPRKCGLNAAYKILYCDSVIPEERIKPILQVGDINMLMMFQASVNDNKCRLGMDTMCQGPGFITESFCENASPPIPISLVSKDPAVTALPTVVTGNGATGLARGFASVQMVIGGFVSTVEFVVFGRFAGFDGVLGQDWLTHHGVVLEMGNGRIIIKTNHKRFVLSSIATKNKEQAYNRTPIPPKSRLLPAIEKCPSVPLDDSAVPEEISGNACALLFHIVEPKYAAPTSKYTPPPSNIDQAYLCHTTVTGSVVYELIPGVGEKIIEIIPVEPVESPLSISVENDILLKALLEKYHSQFGEFAPAADRRPVATTSCIEIDPLASIPNNSLRRYNPGEQAEIQLQVENMLKQKKY
jgi:hypothetical protein